jgi:thiamine pyrophosphokinase
VIAADAGAAVCRAAGRVPDVCVGDFDSIDEATLAWLRQADVDLRHHPVDKDASDLDLALDLARQNGATALDITAAFSGRIDHTLAAFGTLVRAAELAPRALEPSFTAYVIGARGAAGLQLEEPVGTTISLFALDGEVSVTTKGLRYALNAAPLPRHTSLGLSNRADSPRQGVEVLDGRVLVIVSRDAPGDGRSVLPGHPGR